MKATIEQWRMFLALVEHGNYARTAEALDKSVSAVHSSIKNLQQSLGLSLFTLDGRRVTLSDTGHQLLPRARRLIEHADTIDSLADGLAGGTESRLQLAADAIFPRDRLRTALQTLGDDFPHLRIDLHETVLNGAVDLMQQGLADIAITPVVPGVGTFRTLGRVRFTPVAHPEHALHRLDRPLLRDDLRAHRHIVIRDSAPRLADDTMWLESPVFWTVGSMDASIEMLVNGLGFAWLPVSRIGQQLADGTLLPLPMARLNDRHVELFLVWRDMEAAGQVCRRVLELLDIESPDRESTDRESSDRE